VFLQHGLEDIGATWFLNLANQSLGFLLADAGYDVYAGNSRGTDWTSHQTLSTSSREFWDFSYDEMAEFDLPAQVELALNLSGESQLTYIGHSQGTLQAFAAFGDQAPGAVAEKIKLFVALAPVAYVNHVEAMVKLLADIDLVNLLDLIGSDKFFSNMTFYETLFPELCDHNPLSCESLLFAIGGVDKGNLNASRIEVYVHFTPGGTSTKNMLHWSQGVKHKRFAKYDYGYFGNEKHYGQHSPPLYDLSQVTVPTAIFTGGHDTLADPSDVTRLLAELPNSTVIYRKHIEKYEHLDFTWGIDTGYLIYPAILDLIKNMTVMSTAAARTAAALGR